MSAISFLIGVINLIFQIVTLLVIVHVVLSYFMSPYHPVRMFIDRIVSPLLSPIRRLLPQTGMLDFSPLILLLLLQVARSLIINIILAIV